MKKVNYKELSTERCAHPECNKPLKKNLVNKKEGNKPLLCFRCFQREANKGENKIKTASEIRQQPHLRSNSRIEKGIPLKGGA